MFKKGKLASEEAQRKKYRISSWILPCIVGSAAFLITAGMAIAYGVGVNLAAILLLTIGSIGLAGAFIKYIKGYVQKLRTHGPEKHIDEDTIRVAAGGFATAIAEVILGIIFMSIFAIGFPSFSAGLAGLSAAIGLAACAKLGLDLYLKKKFPAGPEPIIGPEGKLSPAEHSLELGKIYPSKHLAEKPIAETKHDPLEFLDCTSRRPIRP